MNPDTLRLEPAAIAFVAAFVEADKPIAAICHGPWTLINANGVEGKTMTSWPSLETDLRNAGAEWWIAKLSSTASSSRHASRTTCLRSARK